MKIQVIPPDPKWSDQFGAEASRIRSALSGIAVNVHHVGSTSIPNIYAKPVIDILLEVSDIEDLDNHTAEMTALGYEAKGEFGIPGRRYFRKYSSAGVRTHQIHAFERNSEGFARHLAFRDYMIAHPLIAQAYSDLKRRLASDFPDDIEAYMDGKDPFIKEHERHALKWQRESAESPAARIQKEPIELPAPTSGLAPGHSHRNH